MNPAVEKYQVKALLFSGVLYASTDICDAVLERLSTLWGNVVLTSPARDFGHSDYYSAEMGRALTRRFLFFDRFIEQSELPRIKQEAIALETEFSVEGKRRINIDPGFLTLAKLVLATTKDYTHRLYLADDIYGEVTLHFQKDQYRPSEWTYPDYKEPQALQFFQKAREELLMHKKTENRQ